MDDVRIIVYNVDMQAEVEIAIRAGVAAYKAKFGTQPVSLTLPKNVEPDPAWLNLDDIQLEIDRFYTAPGTIQIGQ